MKRVCEWCGTGIITTRADARFCSSKHRVYAHRAAKNNPIPRAMLERDRWIRWDRVMRKGKFEKVPFTATGNYASSTNSATWSTFAEANASTVGVGLGYVLGDGIGCIDLDHCLTGDQLTAAAAEFIANYPQHYIEISPSGEGLHIWGQQQEQGGRRQSIGGLSIERYSVGRYITVTGNVYQHGALLPL